MTLREATIILILAAWLLMTALYQAFTSPLSAFGWRWDVLGLVPSYKVFTRTPRNFRLFYRDRSATGELTGWTEVALSHPRRWFHAFWNPLDAVTGVRHSSVDDLVRLIERRKAPAAGDLTERFLYRSVWRIVRRHPTGQGSVARQFKVEETWGHVTERAPQMLFRSEFHPL